MSQLSWLVLCICLVWLLLLKLLSSEYGKLDDAPDSEQHIPATGMRALVCGLRGNTWQTISNACSACNDAEVVGYRNGECGE